MKKRRKFDLRGKSVFIATFTVKFGGVRSYACGPIPPLVDFVTKKAAKTVLVEQPLPQSEDLIPTMEIYQGQNLVKTGLYPKALRFQYRMSKKTKAQGRTMFRLKIRDVISAFYFYFFKSGQARYDLFIGLDSIDALVGIILKKLGLVKTVVYYVFDYTPNRYANRLMNSIYRSLDRFCTYFADYAWNVSSAVEKSRYQRGFKKAKMAPQITVNTGLDLDKIRLLAIESLNKNTLVYAGSLSPENGIEWVVDLMPQIIRAVPRVRLLMIGNGKWLKKLKKKASQKKLNRYVRFTGFILDHRKVERLLCRSYVAVAPYPDMWDSTKKYGDVIKIRTYLACGLPVITSDVPPVSQDIKKKGAGIVYQEGNKKEFIEAVQKIFSDEQFYRRCRLAAIKMAKNNTWDNNFSRAFKKMDEKTA